MKRLLPVLMGFVVLLLSSTEGWSLPPCPEDVFGPGLIDANEAEELAGQVWKEDVEEDEDGLPNRLLSISQL